MVGNDHCYGCHKHWYCVYQGIIFSICTEGLGHQSPSSDRTMCSLLGQWRNKGVQVIKNHSFFHVCHWKSNGRLPWYSWMQRWIYEINLLIEKINHRALNILFFLHKCHSILKLEVKCLRKMKKFDMEFFFKLLSATFFKYQLEIRRLKLTDLWSYYNSFSYGGVFVKCGVWKLCVMASLFFVKRKWEQFKTCKNFLW